MFANLGSAEAARSLEVARELRRAGISAEVYPDTAKMKKQMGRADALGIPYVGIIGETELEAGTVTLKNMTTGEQAQLDIAQLIQTLRR